MLQEDNIILRQLNENDTNVLAQLANNKKIWDNLRDFFPCPYTTDHAVSFIKMTSQEDPRMTFAIEFDGELCGIIGLVAQRCLSQTAEIGYWLGEPFWNKGIATKAVKLITDYGLDQLGFVRLHTGVFDIILNRPSPDPTSPPPLWIICFYPKSNKSHIFL
jgi:ribosomal-protein-alanine N-acetyltransferase